MKTINVNLANKYPIYIGSGIIHDPKLLDFCQQQAAVIIIADDNLTELYAELLQQRLQDNKISVQLLTFTANEQNKSRFTKEELENGMFELGCGRDTCVIALGGGITTDIVGFVAATYCRGVPTVYIPTSLLAMVDASIGGKTGVNTAYGKNLIGSFYQPQAIFSDINTLKTLPQAELENGLAEAIKHAVIKDSKHFDFLQQNAAAILDYDQAVLEELVYTNSRIKVAIVEQDEQDYGIRQLLNFGHTIGHALEVATDYKIKHGAAVAIGMIAESYISMQLGFLSEDVLNKIKDLLKQYNLPTILKHKYVRATARQALTLDKKAKNRQPMFVLLNDIGQIHKPEFGYTSSVTEELINEALDYVSCDDSR